MTRSTDSVNVDFVNVKFLMLNGYHRCRSPRAVLGMHLGRIGQDLPVGENPAIPNFPEPVHQGQRQLSGEGFQGSRLGTSCSEAVVEGLGAVCFGTL